MGQDWSFAKRVAALSLLAVLAAGCSLSDRSDTTTAEPAQPAGMSAAEIRTLLAGRSWRFKGPNNTGTTLYAQDGSSLIEVDGKGTARGRWMTKDGQLCESFDPAPFLPGGIPMSCYPFGPGVDPGTYQAGRATFTPAG